jgi:TadE-like protein
VKRSSAREHGQAVVEFGIIAVVVFALTIGTIDVGRGFYQYNAVSSAARFGARWASVVGGVCVLPGQSTTDWCTQEATASGNFWQQFGNKPLQGNNVICPEFKTNPSVYYSAADPDHDATPDNDFATSADPDNDTVTKSTTIVGAVAQHFDTSSSSTGFVQGKLGGFDLTKVRVCIQTSNPAADQTRGDYVSVVVYYHFDPVTFLIAKSGFDLSATSEYVVEG